MISTAGGLLASGRTAEAEGGQVYVGGRHGVEVMSHLYAGLDRRLLFDSQGNLISDTLDWEQSEGGQVQVESPGLVLIGGYARNASSEVVLEQDVTLEIQWIMGDGQPDSFTAVLPADVTHENSSLDQLRDQLQEVLDEATDGSALRWRSTISGSCLPAIMPSVFGLMALKIYHFSGSWPVGILRLRPSWVR